MHTPFSISSSSKKLWARHAWLWYHVEFNALVSSPKNTSWWIKYGLCIYISTLAASLKALHLCSQVVMRYPMGTSRLSDIALQQPPPLSACIPQVSMRRPTEMFPSVAHSPWCYKLAIDGDSVAVRQCVLLQVVPMLLLQSVSVIMSPSCCREQSCVRVKNGGTSGGSCKSSPLPPTPKRVELEL
jgi:hypothetical protein